MKNLIPRYLTNSLTLLERNTLLKWLAKSKNQKIFKAYIKDDYHLNTMRQTDDMDAELEKVWLDVQRKDTKVMPFYSKPIFKYTAAASILIFITVGFWFLQTDNFLKPQFQQPIIVNNQIETGTDKAILTLDNGEQIALEKGETYQSDNTISNGKEITYLPTSKQDSNNISNEIVYNYLTIPRGGQFRVTLADGTKVWLNSESKLKYPTAFAKGKSRQVELVYGEAYFDASPSSNHEGTKFQVVHELQTIEVLGTEFNVKAYRDESHIYTTLVEGKVALMTEEKKKLLIPTEQARLDRLTNRITIESVDIYEAISWKHGVFNFKRKSLKEIMTVLSRWYDMDVIFDNKAIEDLKFIGTLYRRQTIEEIMFSIKNTNLINNYEINNKTITLN